MKQTIFLIAFLSVAGHIHSQTLNVEDKIRSSGLILNAKDFKIPESLESATSGDIFSVTNELDEKVAGISASGSAEFSQVKTSDLAVDGTLEGNENIRGVVTLLPGKSKVTIFIDWPTPPLSITANASYDSYVWIDKINESGFTLNVGSSSEEEENIFWQAIW